MTIDYYGTIEFKRELSPDELAEIKRDVELNYKSSFSSTDVYLEQCWDVLCEISDWLKEHNNDVKEWEYAEYYGDYDGSERYEGGEWVGYDATTIPNLSDEELISELQGRGYKVIK